MKPEWTNFVGGKWQTEVNVLIREEVAEIGGGSSSGELGGRE